MCPRGLHVGRLEHGPPLESSCLFPLHTRVPGYAWSGGHARGNNRNEIMRLAWAGQPSRAWAGQLSRGMDAIPHPPSPIPHPPSPIPHPPSPIWRRVSRLPSSPVVGAGVPLRQTRTCRPRGHGQTARAGHVEGQGIQRRARGRMPCPVAGPGVCHAALA
jgi:hypothetical protein